MKFLALYKLIISKDIAIKPFLRLKSLGQSGMSAILFTMIFITVLTLMSIGFATLVRNDQRQVIDKSLSYQAQYAAETAINRQAEIFRSSGYTSNNPTCGAPIAVGDATVTCVTWNNEVDEITYDNLSSGKPFVTKFDSSAWPAAGTGDVKISWNSSAGRYSSFTAGQLPDIESSKPILRLTISDGADWNNHKNFYIVPSDVSTSIDATGADGVVVQASCTGAGDSSCTSGAITVKTGSMASIVALGGTTKITITSTIAGQKLRGAQIEIDANARIQEVTKRLVAKINLLKDVWRPAFAVSANTICKDYIVDGTQDTRASTPVKMDPAVLALYPTASCD